MGRRSVFSIGVMGLAGPLKGLGVVVAGDGRFEDILKDLPDCAVVVLGDLALGVFDPGVVSETAVLMDWEVLLCPVLSPPATAGRWTSRNEFTHVKSVASLPASIAHARGTPPRLASPLAEWAADWLRKCSCGRCAGYLRVALQLRKPTRKAWAARLGMKVTSLWRLIKQCLGVAPREILNRMKRCAISLGSKLGRTMAEIADALGYSSPRSLRRARRTLDGEDALPTKGVDNSNNLSPCTRLTEVLPRTTIRQPIGISTRAPPETEEDDGDAAK